MIEKVFHYQMENIISGKSYHLWKIAISTVPYGSILYFTNDLNYVIRFFFMI